MNIKTIVKVMNFHALLRVDRARKDAEKYAMLEERVVHMLGLIQNNRNFILDKWVLIPKPGTPRLRIFIGSDLGFCGSVNASVNNGFAKVNPGDIVVSIGRKLRPEEASLSMNRDEFNERFPELLEIIAEGIRGRGLSGIDLCYNHYHNMSNIEFMERAIFPLEMEKDELETYSEDFAVEGSDVNTLIENLIITYLNYEIKSAVVSAFASENIFRQSATNDSLNKIEEMELEERWERQRIRNEEAARKVIDSYVKTHYGD